jgi:hypothetical protein
MPEAARRAKLAARNMDAIRFKTTYDAGRLREDLAAAVAAAPWIAKPERGKYYKWSALPLHGLRGDVSAETVDMHVIPEGAADCAMTSIGAACGYVAEIINGFAAAKLRVRFMCLAAGGRIGRHRDRAYGWTLPVLRLHVPVVTDASVEFLLNERRIVMRAGELWYLDTTRDHEAVNRGVKDRVHLVIDLVNGPEIRAQLGPETWAEVLAPEP